MTASPEARDSTALSSELRLAVIRLTRRLRTARPDTGLTLGQISLLFTLDKHGPMTAGALAAAEGLQPPSATRTLAALESLGLVQRCEGATDRRQSVVSLTDEARALVDEDRRRRDALLADLLDGLTPEEHQTLARAIPLLQRLAEQ